jgi:NAD(P)-dependent dehydrogenase (short-subunit alcohol dehydrogenase family)
MIILCAATLTPPGKPKRMTSEGLEETWMVNYLSNFHLLSILSPAIRAQPADRDVRILFSTCPSYISSPPLPTANSASARKPTSGKAAKSSTATGASNATTTIESLALGTDPDFSPSNAYARSKLALLTFGHAFQKHLSSYKRPDGLPPNARVIFVDPGYTRTPGMRRYLSRGTLWGLALYLLLWQNIWFLLKSSEQGAQSFLFAAMEAGLGRGEGGRLVKECMEVDFARGDVKDEKVAEHLWKESERIIERVEREEAVKRALVKKEKEAKEKSEKVVEVVEEEAPKKPSRRTKKKAAEVLADL